MSGLIDPVNLAAARAGIPLYGRCTILAAVDTSSTQTWPGPGVTVDCMKGNPGRGGTEQLSYDGTAPATRFWVPVDTAIATGYRLVYPVGGRTYLVDMLPPVHADEILRPVDCIEVRSPREEV